MVRWYAGTEWMDGMVLDRKEEMVWRLIVVVVRSGWMFDLWMEIK